MNGFCRYAGLPSRAVPSFLPQGEKPVPKEPSAPAILCVGDACVLRKLGVMPSNSRQLPFRLAFSSTFTSHRKARSPNVRGHGDRGDFCVDFKSVRWLALRATLEQ